jgi:hypothetical protein
MTTYDRPFGRHQRYVLYERAPYSSSRTARHGREAHGGPNE